MNDDSAATVVGRRLSDLVSRPRIMLDDLTLNLIQMAAELPPDNCNAPRPPTRLEREPNGLLVSRVQDDSSENEGEGEGGGEGGGGRGAREKRRGWWERAVCASSSFFGVSKRRRRYLEHDVAASPSSPSRSLWNSARRGTDGSRPLNRKTKEKKSREKKQHTRNGNHLLDTGRNINIAEIMWYCIIWGRHDLKYTKLRRFFRGFNTSVETGEDVGSKGQCHVGWEDDPKSAVLSQRWLMRCSMWRQ